MEKAVVRRGIGAVVLALVAALLLGYLLKDKGPERRQVVNMELPKSPIQIFPSDEAVDKGVVATNSGAGSLDNIANDTNSEANASGVSTAAVAAGAVAGGVAATGFLAKAKGIFSFGDKDDDVKVKATDSASEGNKVAQLTDSEKAGLKSDKSGLGKDQAIDSKTGNASLAKANVTVDGAGQAVFGVKKSGPTNTPAQIDFRTTAKKEVRPSVESSATLTKSKVASDSTAKTKVVSSKSEPQKSQPRKSNARLVGEKKLPPVKRGIASSKKKKSSESRKIASSKGKRKSSSKKKSSSRSKKSSSRSKKIASKSKKSSSKSKKIASKSKKSSSKSKKIASSRNADKAKKVAKTSSQKKSKSGRNKYVVQLLATSNSSKANSLRVTLKKEGYPVFVSKSKRAGKALYRVRVGSYSGKSAAIRKQASMKRRYRKNSYIQSSIVVKN